MSFSLIFLREKLVYTFSFLVRCEMTFLAMKKFEIFLIVKN